MGTETMGTEMMGTETTATSEPQTCSQFSSYTKGTRVLMRQELEEQQYLRDSMKKRSSQGKLRNCETQSGTQAPRHPSPSRLSAHHPARPADQPPNF